MATIKSAKLKDKTIACDVRVKVGEIRKSARFRTKAECREWAAQTEADIRARVYTLPSASPTVSDAIDRYIREVMPSKRNAHKSMARFRYWQQALGLVKVSDVTPETISTHVAVIAKDRSSSTVARYIAASSHVLTACVKCWGYIDSNPALKINKPRNNPGRLRYLTQAEITQLLDACKSSTNPMLCAFVLMGLATGARAGELQGLRWSDIDWGRVLAKLEPTKNVERRYLPLDEMILNIIKTHRDGPGIDDNLGGHVCSWLLVCERPGKEP